MAPSVAFSVRLHEHTLLGDSPLVSEIGHRGEKGILLFFQKTRTLQSRGVVTLFHLFTIAIYGRNCFDMQH